MREISSLIPETVRNLLLAEESVSLLVRGTSMLPYLRAGDRVWVQKAEWNGLRIGDLIVFERNQTLYTHRLIWKYRDILVTKGDNLPFPDPALGLARVLGRVVAFERGGKRYYLEGKNALVGVVLGCLHAILGLLGQGLLGVERIVDKKWKWIIFWIGKGFLVPVKFLERILAYVE